MKRDWLIKVSAAALSALMLASCGGNSGNSGKSGGGETKKPETPAKTEKKEGEKSSNVTLSVSMWDENQRPGLEKIMADFTAKTGIKTEVQLVNWENYWTQLSAGASGGQLPDVFWMHSNESQKYMENHMLLDLTDRIKNSKIVNLDNYPSEIVELYTSQGKHYAVPKDVDTIALWYNKTMFDAKGVKYPTADWTWQDMYDAAVKLTDKDKGIYGFAMGPDNNQAGYYNLIYDFGGYVISPDKKKSGFDDPNTLKAMELVDKFVKNTMPSLQIITENKEDGLFTSGKVAMVTQGSWMLPVYKQNDYTKKNCDIAVLPKEGDKRISIYNGLGWAAAANTKHPDEAWKLIEYLGSKEAQEKQASLGITMSAYKNTSATWAKSASFNLQAYLDMMKDMVIRPYSRNTVVWENKLTDAMKQVWEGTKDMDTACKDFAAAMNQVLAQE